MLSNPKAGWCELEIGNFKGTPSYLTDVPVDLLTAFINYYKRGIGAAFFDEEGTEFNLLLSDYSIYIIHVTYEGNPVLYCFSDINIDDLANELITDIKNDINAWSYFSASCSRCLKWQSKDKLLTLTDELQKLTNIR